MKYIYLNEKFYRDFPKDLYPELEIKKERPYVQIVIEINNVMFALPLRSNIHINMFIDNTYAVQLVNFSSLQYFEDSIIEI